MSDENEDINADEEAQAEAVAAQEQAEAEAKMAEITRQNKARVQFSKPEIKFIVSHHSGTILAKDEPNVDFSINDNSELKERVLAAYKSVIEPEDEEDGATPDAEGKELVIITKDLLPELFLRSGLDFDDDLSKTIIDRFYKNNGATEGDSVSEDTYCRIVESAQAPAFQFGQHLRKYSSRGQIREVVTLLARGCDPNCGDGDGLNALHYACNYNHPKVVETLFTVVPEEDLILEARDKHGWTPLYCAVHHNSLDCVKLLLERGANPAIKNNSGKTCLHAGASRGRTAIVELLLHATAAAEAANKAAQDAAIAAAEAEAEPASRPPTGKKDSHPVTAATDDEPQGPRYDPDFRGLEWLLTEQDNKGMTALHDAAYRGQANMYNLLAKNPLADLSIKDDLGNLACNYLNGASFVGGDMGSGNSSGPTSPNEKK